jgi:hypothetical protein
MFSSTSFQSVLLALQCMLIVWLFAGQTGGVAQQQTQQQSVVSIEKPALGTITISADDGDKVVLKKQNGSWILPDYHDLAVNTGLLDQMLEKLAAARPSWPIAQTADAAERFHVSPAKFKRHLRLQSTADVVEDLYLGDSPGLRKIYIRNEDADAIYTIEFGLHLAPASAEQWFDKNLLKPGGDIKEIHAADFVLVKQADDWGINDLAEQESLDQDKIVNLVNYLQYPQVQAVAAEALVSKVKKLKPVAQYRVKTRDAEVSYDLFKTDEQHILKSSLSDLYFTVADFVADTIAGVKRDALITKAADDTEEAD